MGASLEKSGLRQRPRPILFPAAPEEAGLRFFVASCYSEDQIRFMVTALAEELELLNARR